MKTTCLPLCLISLLSACSPDSGVSLLTLTTDEDTSAQSPVPDSAETSEQDSSERVEFSSIITTADTMVHLFQWPWTQVAQECTDVLGPAGIAAVQISPAQTSIEGSQWWTLYQPVSYAIDNRLGSRAEFQAMNEQCASAGVRVYADVVLNHMAAGRTEFPDVPYGSDDFHTCTSGIDYSDDWSVKNCQLVSLSDLKTESDYVRQKEAAYLNDLISLGVQGFRVDAAKHINPEDLMAIELQLSAERYIVQEVYTDELSPASRYTDTGDITEFNFGTAVGEAFKGSGHSLSELAGMAERENYWVPSYKAVIFLANHDTMRYNADEVITYADDPAVQKLANAYMLAQPYGKPKLIADYSISSYGEVPPTADAASCSDGWYCQHHDQTLINMIAFREVTASADSVSNWWDNGGNQIAFSRGNLGFIAINRDDSAYLQQTLQTGLPEGEYCDIYQSDGSASDCTDHSISVNGDGYATFNIPPMTASALHVEALVTE